MNQDIFDLLKYQQKIFSSHEYWRILTAHFIHINTSHFTANMLGFLLFTLINNQTMTTTNIHSHIILLSCFISLCFTLFNPQIHWYAGFSGILYGLYTLGFIRQWIVSKNIGFLILLIGLIGKIISDQINHSQNIKFNSLLEIPVVVDSHFYGMIYGILIGAFHIARNFSKE